MISTARALGAASRNSSILSHVFLVRSLSKMDNIEAGKRAAAYAAVDDLVQDGQVVGVGSGSTVVYAVNRIAERVEEEKLKLICVPTSFQAKQLILENRLVLGDLERNPQLDIDLDGADEVDKQLNLIKGGGACLTQEKIVASCAHRMAVIADYRKESESLGETWKGGVPLEVIPLAYMPIINKIEKILGGKAKLRLAKNKAGPVVSDNGNFIVDWEFDTNITYDWKEINMKLKMIPGVVETGLFIDMAFKAYFGQADGTVSIRDRLPLNGALR